MKASKSQRKQLKRRSTFLVSGKNIWSSRVTKIKPVDKEAALGAHSKNTPSIERKPHVCSSPDYARIRQLIKEVINAPEELRDKMNQEVALLMFKKAKSICKNELRQYKGNLRDFESTKEYKFLLKKKVSEYQRNHGEELAKTIEIEQNKLEEKILFKRKNIYKEIIGMLMANKNSLDKLEALLMLICTYVETKREILPDDFSTLIKAIQRFVSQEKMPRGFLSSFSLMNRLNNLSLKFNSLPEKGA